MPTVCTSISALRGQLAPWRRSGTVGLVPTMGALHEGHARLIDEARRDCARVVVTIFVNPLQFDRADDLQRYPRQLEADLDLCRAHGVDAVFAPPVDDMYPSPPICAVDVGRLADHLCGRHRPGHFRGVATVVLKLLQIAQADRAYFGEKDAQQLAIIKQLVADFSVPVTIVGVPTVREADGLALSSRNVHLGPDARRAAPALYQALREAERLVGAGEADAGVIRDRAVARVPDHPGLRLEYFEIVDPIELQPVATVIAPVLVAGALWAGSTRLIDNILCRPPASGA